MFSACWSGRADEPLLNDPVITSKRPTVLSYLSAAPGPSGWSSKSTALEVVQGSSEQERHDTARVVLITGATSEVARAACMALCHADLTLVLGCRDGQRGKALAADITHEAPSARVHVLPCDLSSLRSTRQFVEAFKALNLPLHILIHGASTTSSQFALTEDGFELQFAVNHLAPFLINQLLMPLMARSVGADLPQQAATAEASSAPAPPAPAPAAAPVPASVPAAAAAPSATGPAGNSQQVSEPLLTAAAFYSVHHSALGGPCCPGARCQPEAWPAGNSSNGSSCNTATAGQAPLTTPHEDDSMTRGPARAPTLSARIIFLSCSAHHITYIPGRADGHRGLAWQHVRGAGASWGFMPAQSFGQSKLACIMQAQELSRRCTQQQLPVRAFAVHPGITSGGLKRYGGLAPGSWLHQLQCAMSEGIAYLGALKSPEQAAATLAWAALSPQLEEFAGSYLEDCNVSVPSPAARNDMAAAALWQKSADAVALWL